MEGRTSVWSSIFRQHWRISIRSLQGFERHQRAKAKYPFRFRLGSGADRVAFEYESLKNTPVLADKFICSWMNSMNGLLDKCQDGILQRDAMIAERVIGFYLDVQRLSICILFECFEQGFAVRPAAVVCRN